MHTEAVTLKIANCFIVLLRTFFLSVSTFMYCSYYRLFVLPHYCSPIADISLLHSRRIVSGTTESKKYEESIPTKVYICATMWHENRTEMKQIMKTLFRYVNFSLHLIGSCRSIAGRDKVIRLSFLPSPMWQQLFCDRMIGNFHT